MLSAAKEYANIVNFSTLAYVVNLTWKIPILETFFQFEKLVKMLFE